MRYLVLRMKWAMQKTDVYLCTMQGRLDLAANSDSQASEYERQMLVYKLNSG